MVSLLLLLLVVVVVVAFMLVRLAGRGVRLVGLNNEIIIVINVLLSLSLLLLLGHDLVVYVFFISMYY